MLKKFNQIINSHQAKKSEEKTRLSNFSSAEFDIFDFLDLVKNWQQVVGEMLAHNSIPLKLKNKVLTIITKHPAIAQELNFMSEMIRNNITKSYPQMKGQIDKIIFQNSPVIFDQMKEDEKKFEEEMQARKLRKHEYSPEYREKKIEALKFYGDLLEGDLDPEMKELMINLKIQKDRR